MRPLLRPLVVISVGIALIAAGLTAGYALRPPADFGALTAPSSPAAGHTPPPRPDAAAAPTDPAASPEPDAAASPPAPSAEATGPTARPGPSVSTRSARLDDHTTSDHQLRPTRLALPALDVDAPVAPVGVLASTREMEIPDDVRTVGWYRYGAAPGTGAGTVVLAAHVDDRQQGRGVFFDLHRLRAGDVVTLEVEDGEQRTYRVTARRQLPKDELPNDLFDRTGPPRLALVTCGGEFDPARRSYRDNIVVLAEPVGR